MTYKNAKTILFASLIAAMILPFSGMNNAYADANKIPDEILKIAEKGGKIANRIADLELVNEDGKFDSQIEKLQAKLSDIEEIVDDYGLFSPEQMKIEMNKPIIATDEEEQIMINCGCSTAVVFSSGIFYQMFGWFQGMSEGPVKVLVDTNTYKTSTEQAHTSINQDWGYLYTRAKIVDGSGQAELHVKPWIERSNGNIIKTYSEHNILVSSTNYIKVYESKFTNNAVGDNYIIKGNLNWLS